MGTNTVNYSFYLPTPNSPLDANTWGTSLNQNNFTIVDTSIYNTALSNISNTAPTAPNGSPKAGQAWINNTTATAWAVQLYDGAQWLTTGTIDSINHVYIPNGTVVGVNVQTFTSSGTYTPTPGMDNCIIECIGGGGGGGGTGSAFGFSGFSAGGGSGAYTKAFFSVATIGASQSVIVGTGGAGGLNTGAAGGNGTVSGVGTLISAPGGFGGFGNNSIPTPPYTGGFGGAAGTASSGLITNQTGTTGSLPISTAFISGAGAPTIYGIPGAAQMFTNNTYNVGLPGTLGAGGSGAGYNGGVPTNNGGAGGNGIVIITEYI